MHLPLVGLVQINPRLHSVLHVQFLPGNVKFNLRWALGRKEREVTRDAAADVVTMRATVNRGRKPIERNIWEWAAAVDRR